MIAYAVTEMPWRDSIINHQHIFNEFMTYFICIFLLLFNGFVDARTRYNLGYLLIAVVTIFLFYNGILMMRKVTKLIKLLLRKWRVHRQQRSLMREANLIAKQLKITITDWYAPVVPQNENGENIDNDIENRRPKKITYADTIQLEILRMATGGIRLYCGQDEKAMALLIE